MTVKTSLGLQTKKYTPPPKILCDDDRTVTDGKYRILFCFILTIWLVSCLCALSCKANKASSHKNVNIAHHFTHQNFTATKNTTYHHSITAINITHDHSIIANNITHHNSTAKNETQSKSTVQWIKDMFFFYVNTSFHLKPCIKDRVSSVIFWASLIFYSALILLAMRIMHVWAVMSPPALIVKSSTMIIISIIYHVTQYFANDINGLEPQYERFLYWVGPEAVLLIISTLTFFNVMRYTGVSEMNNLLKSAFRFYVKCRYLLIIGVLLSAIILILNVFAAKVLKDFSLDSIASKIIYSIIYCGSCYLIIVTYAFGRMVISATVASYYWNENDEKSPFVIMWQKFDSISDYHFGSACCKATFASLWFIPLVYGVLGFEFEDYKTAAGYCLIFDLLQFTSFDTTVCFIGMYGVSASDSLKLCLYLIVKTKKMFAMICQGFWSATFIILFPTNCILLILMWGLNEHNELFSLVSTSSYLDVFIFSLPVIFVFGTIEDARAICILTDRAEKEEFENEKSLEEPIQVKIITDSNVDNENKMKN